MYLTTFLRDQNINKVTNIFSHSCNFNEFIFICVVNSRFICHGWRYLLVYLFYLVLFRYISYLLTAKFTAKKLIAKWTVFKFLTVKAPKNITFLFIEGIQINDHVVDTVLFLTLPLLLFCLFLPQNTFALLEIITSPNKNREICGTKLRL